MTEQCDRTTDLRVYPDWMMQSVEAVLDMIESDFGQSGRDVRLEAIRCELWEAHSRGLNARCSHDIDWHWGRSKGACIKCGAEFMKAVYVDNKEPHQLEPGEWCSWDAIIYAHCPGPGRLITNLSNHTATIPSRGVLTVSPSILCTDGAGGHRFHGFIENGVWLGEDRQPVK